MESLRIVARVWQQRCAHMTTTPSPVQPHGQIRQLHVTRGVNTAQKSVHLHSLDKRRRAQQRAVFDSVRRARLEQFLAQQKQTTALESGRGAKTTSSTTAAPTN